MMCRKEKCMPTNLALDEELLKEAQKIGGHRTKKNAVNEALKEYIMKRKQKDILSLFGKVDMEPAYDYKKERKSR
jgi:Arc/MetJ family transcription regulator